MYVILVTTLFSFLLKKYFLQGILMSSDSTLAILKPTVKRDQTASVFT